jgi:phage shock protein A
MGIMSRVIQIFKADVHGVMDRLEDQESLLKQHLRDMAETLNLKELKLKKMCISRQQAQQEYDKYSQQAEALERDLVISIEKNKDDIARMVIRKMKPLENLCDEMADHIRILDEDILQHKSLLNQQRLQYEHLKHRSIDFFHKAQVREQGHNLCDAAPGGRFGELSDQEIELELLKRKEALDAV